MRQYIILLYGILLLKNVIADEYDEDETVPPIALDAETMEKGLEQFEFMAMEATKEFRQGAPTEQSTLLYEEMILNLDDLLQGLKNPNHADVFLKAKGIDRVIVPNIKLPYDDLRTRLLKLLKKLFIIAPTTTSAVIPTNLVDSLLDIFENDDNLALKAHALDILYIWLPGNPRIQARVMKLKGLEPFYDQISKLDVSVIQTLLDLFNKILVEHLKARREGTPKTKSEAEKLALYKRIGLIERMSTATVCDGILNILETAWAYNSNHDVMVTVFDLIKNAKSFCLTRYKGKTKAIEVIKVLSKYYLEDSKTVFIEKGLNITDVKLVFDDYREVLTYASVRTEF